MSSRRLPLVAAALLALLAGLWTGLVRLGFTLPPVRAGLPAAHGALMVSGFLGTVIGLERAVAVGRRWGYAAPLLSALAVIFLLAGVRPLAAPSMALAGLFLLAASLAVVLIQPWPFTLIMAVGSACWLVGNLLWMSGRPVPALVQWWIAFPTLTIAGERLQLSRVVGTTRGEHRMLYALVGLLLAAAIFASVWGAPWVVGLGWRLAGVALLGLAVWLLRHDIARRNLRQPGLRRFIGTCLISGYVWLAVAGGLMAAWGAMTAGPRYDAVVHAVFLGFVFAMIFGHAPIILPALSGREVPFHPSFYAHLVVLNASLALRLAGDLSGWPPGRAWGGLFNALALLLFPLMTARAVVMGRGRGREMQG